MKKRTLAYILLQFLLIAVAALLAFHVGNVLGRSYQYVGEELVLVSFWQFYAFAALGFAILIGGGYATYKLDTKGFKV